MTDLTEHSLVELAALIRRGKASPVAVMEAHLARIQELNPSLRALVMVSPQALEQAQKAEAALASNQSLGPLHGVPLTVKDTIDTAGLRTASGSRVLKRYVPQEDAPAVARLRAAGAIILGKTNVSELAVAYDAENPVFGRTNNPHDLARTPGGSSGGEAAAISACLAPGGIGSDLAGSLRIPAHFCGIVGLKPTNGAVAGEGQWPHAVGPLSLGATLGPLARRVADVHLLFEVMSLRRRKGSRSFSEPNAFLLNYANRLRGRKFLWYADDSCATVAPIIAEAVETAAKALERAGLAGRQEIPPGVAAGPRLWHGLFSHAAAQQLRVIYEGRNDQAGPAVQALWRAQARQPAPTLATFWQTWQERDTERGRLLAALEETPLLVAPVGAVAAPLHGTHRLTVGAQEISLFQAFGYAQTFNVYGLPAVSVPVAWTPEGLPVGVQIVGRPFAEHEVLAAAMILENALGGWRKPLYSSFQ